MKTQIESLYDAYRAGPSESLRMAIADCLMEMGEESKAMPWLARAKRKAYGGSGSSGSSSNYGYGSGGYGYGYGSGSGGGGYGSGGGHDGDGYIYGYGLLQITPKGARRV